MKPLFLLNKRISLALVTLVMVFFTNYANANCNFHAGFTFTASSTNCKQINFTNTSFVTNASDSGVSYIWMNGTSAFSTAKNSSFTFSANGSYTICLIMFKQITGGICSDTVCQTVTVNCNSGSACNWGTVGWEYTRSCTSKNIYFTAGNSDTSGTYTYTWAFGDGTYDTLNHKVTYHNYTINGQITPCLIIKKYVNGILCKDTTICKVISVSVPVKDVDFSFTQSSTNCKSFVFTINDSNNMTNTACAYYRYTWGDGTTSLQTSKTSPTTHTFPSNGNYTVCIKAMRCTDTICSTSRCYTVNVNCSGGTSCNFGANGYFSVWDSCKALYGYVGPANPCYKYTWKVNSTVVSHDRFGWSYPITANGTYTICVQIQDTCKNCDTIYCGTRTITCFNNTSGCTFPSVYWGFNYNCSTRTVSFSGYNADTVGSYKYLWSFGDGSYDTMNHKSTTHLYPNNGTYNVCLKISKYVNGVVCKDSIICKSVTVTSCTSTCALSGSWGYSIACPARVVSFEGHIADTSGIYTYLWSFGDNSNGASSRIATHTYSSNGTYNVCLTIKRYSSTNTTTPCHDTTICKQISVNCNSNTSCSLYASWTYSLYCPYKYVSFTTYVGDTTGTYSYLWSFGDSSATSSSRNVTHMYAANGNYTVCLKVKRYIPGTTTVCKDTIICKTVSVNCNSTCTLTGGWSYTVACPAKSVHFSSYVGDTTGTYSYLWNYGDNTTGGTTKDPSHTYASNGTYTVCLTIKRFTANSNTVCRDTVICKAITINCTSTCSIYAGWSASVACPGRVATFTTSVADTTGYYTYAWNFGDNSNAGTTRNLTHTYSSNGTYTVCLTIKRYNIGGGTTAFCKDTTICKTITVNCTSCNMVAGFNFGVNCALKKVEVTNTSSGDTCFTSKWAWGDGTYSNDKNPSSHTYSQAGTYNVCLIVRKCSDTTCVNYICKSVVIPSNCCTSHAYFGATINCPNKKVEVINYSYGDTCMNYIWFWGDGGSSTAKNPGNHVYSAAGTYTLCLKVTKCNDTTCINYFCKTIVIPTVCCPVPNFYFYNFCNSYRFINTTQGGTSFWWSFGDSSFSSQKSPYHSFFSKRSFQVCLTVYDSVKNCSTTVCKTVTVNCGWFGGGNHFEVPLSDGNIGNAAKAVEENTDLTPSKGLQMNTQAGITAYPNPTSEILNIIMPAANSTVKITDITGAVLMQFDNVSSFYKADVSRLAAGVYFVNVINENGMQSVRFMKN